ncbi:velvet complex subunit B-like [Anopheles albimanus]|uniref:velvet complex subunit B-like n=1 Tax=Anopheles albimanus TaxID=7167 RepID=UPI00163E4C30|nr:velvet complex subunit B-like [Anopheles albimanus]
MQVLKVLLMVVLVASVATGTFHKKDKHKKKIVYVKYLAAPVPPPPPPLPVYHDYHAQQHYVPVHTYHYQPVPVSWLYPVVDHQPPSYPAAINHPHPAPPLQGQQQPSAGGVDSYDDTVSVEAAPLP